MITRSPELLVGGPPSLISSIRPSSMTTVAWVLGSGFTQSITLALVSINRKVVSPSKTSKSDYLKVMHRAGSDSASTGAG